MICPICFGRKYDFKKDGNSGYFVECKKCHGTGIVKSLTNEEWFCGLCPQCGFPRVRDCGNGFYQCDDCGAHFDKDENIVLTEQEHIQTCDTEQLADILMKIFVTRTFCHICPEGGVCDIGYKCKYSGGRKNADWVEWLKQPHQKE